MMGSVFGRHLIKLDQFRFCNFIFISEPMGFFKDIFISLAKFKYTRYDAHNGSWGNCLLCEIKQSF